MGISLVSFVVLSYFNCLGNQSMDYRERARPAGGIEVGLGDGTGCVKVVRNIKLCLKYENKIQYKLVQHFAI